jgi:hypothetical protein
VIATVTVTAIIAGLPRQPSGQLGTGLEWCLLAVLLAEASPVGAAIPASLNVSSDRSSGSRCCSRRRAATPTCELTALPHAITCRRDHVGCIFLAPIDAADGRRQS